MHSGLGAHERADRRQRRRTADRRFLRRRSPGRTSAKDRRLAAFCDVPHRSARRAAHRHLRHDRRRRSPYRRRGRAPARLRCVGHNARHTGAQAGRHAGGQAFLPVAKQCGRVARPEALRRAWHGCVNAKQTTPIDDSACHPTRGLNPPPWFDSRRKRPAPRAARGAGPKAAGNTRRGAIARARGASDATRRLVYVSRSPTSRSITGNTWTTNFSWAAALAGSPRSDPRNRPRWTWIAIRTARQSSPQSA